MGNLILSKCTSLWISNSTASFGCVCTSIKHIYNSGMAKNIRQPKYLLKWSWVNKWKCGYAMEHCIVVKNYVRAFGNDLHMLIWKDTHVSLSEESKLQNNLITLIPWVGVYIYIHIYVFRLINVYIHVQVHIHRHPYIYLVNSWNNMLLNIRIYLLSACFLSLSVLIRCVWELVLCVELPILDFQANPMILRAS